MKNILIITTSERANGNSNRLAKEFARGAAESGNAVETIDIAKKNVGFCRGCLACQKTGKCVISDDAAEIIKKMNEADEIAFATPIYYYSVSARLKNMFDRSNPLYDGDYKFRSIYLLATAADSDMSAVNGAETAVRGWVDCFPGSNLKAVVFAGGVNLIGDISGHKALNEAYNLGKSIN